MNFKHDQGIMPEFALVFPTGDLIRRNATTKYDQFKVFFNTETATIRENGDRSGSIATTTMLVTRVFTMSPTSFHLSITVLEN